MNQEDCGEHSRIFNSIGKLSTPLTSTLTILLTSLQQIGQPQPLSPVLVPDTGKFGTVGR